VILTSDPPLQPPLDADNTQNVSSYMISSSKSSSISGSKETRAAQREGITNSETIVSASSMQLPVHLVSNSLPSRNPQPSRALRENGSNISLPVVAPGPEETRKRNESPHPQEDSRGQSTVIRPHAVQVDRTASVQPFIKPSTSYPPPSSSSGRTATRPHAEPVNRTASSSVQPSIKPSTSYPSPFSSSERNATRPHAEPVNRTASVQPPAKPSTPTPPLDRPSASILPSSSPPAPALAEMTSNRMHPPRGMPSYESQAQSREALSELPHPPLVDRGNVHSDDQGRKDHPGASRRPPANPEHTIATTKPPRQDHKVPSAVPQRPPVPPEPIPTTTDLPSRQDHKVPSATSDRPPVPPKQTSATTVSPTLQDPKDASTTLSRPPVLPKHAPATTDPPSNSLSQPVSGPGDLNRSESGIQGNEGVDRGAVEGSSSVAEERNRVLAPEGRENRLKDSAKPNPTTSHAQDVPQHPRTPSESSLQRTYSSFRSRGYGSSAPYPPDANDSRRKVGLSSGHSAEQPAATKSSVNKYHPQSSAKSLSLRHDSLVYVGAPDTQREPSSGSSSSEEHDEPVPVQPVPMERHTGDGPRTRVAGDEPQRAQQHQAKPSAEGGNFVRVKSSSPPDSDAGKSRDPDRPVKLFGNAVDARPLPAQPLSTSKSHRT
jgi:hypothetical protein